jgi:type VI secretion system secreted protein VgrG
MVVGIDTLSITTPLPASSFVVTGLNAQERISQPFSYGVELDSGAALLTATQLIDQSVTVTLGDPSTTGRYFNGICQAVRQMPASGGAPNSLWRYRLTVVPRLWFLGQTRACRFFQNMTAPNIVKTILEPFNIDVSWKLQDSYATREYTVMFNESYLHFIQRLLEDEGIFYFFQHGASSHTLVMADYKTAFPKLANEATFRQAQGSYDMASWEQQDATTLGQVTVDDYNPATVTLGPAAMRGQVNTTSQDSGAAQRTHYGWTAVRQDATEVTRVAILRAEAAEAAGQIFAGSGGMMDFVAGGRFTLNNDPTAGGGDYVLRSVSYQVVDNADRTGGATNAVAMTCTAFPANTQWRETPSFAVPVMAGLYTAQVIGPENEEIYIDDLGRIKVWFPWDLESEITQDKTLWVRVMQPWGGAGWGTQFIPRIGMEVAVAFLEGDVNRPCVVGSFYNSQNTPLFSPSDKNKSGIRSRSTLQGGAANYNEMSFDDTKGSEVFLIHAEKDHTIEVENDQTLTVGNDRSVTVTQDETVVIKGKQTITVTGDHAQEIKTGNHAVTVDTGNHALKVSQGNQSTTVSMGNRSAEIAVGNESVKVDLGTITYEAMQSITLKVGANSIVIDQTGITLKGMMIQATGQAMASVKAPMVQVNGSGMLTLAGAITMIN